MTKSIINVNKINSISDLIKKSKWLEGKTLIDLSEEIKKFDPTSRVITKGNIGHLVEKGFFGLEKNSDANPDIIHLGVEIKTSPLKLNKSRTKLSVKEPLSLNMINYVEESKSNGLKESSLYKKNRNILFILYLHDENKKRSDYKILKIFLWKMTDEVLTELEPDYNLIQSKILQGKAHEIHQNEHKFLTLCPKHSGKFKDPNCRISKRKQPFSDKDAEARAFRLKNKYVNLIINREINGEESEKSWDAEKLI